MNLKVNEDNRASISIAKRIAEEKGRITRVVARSSTIIKNTGTNVAVVNGDNNVTHIGWRKSVMPTRILNYKQACSRLSNS